MEGILYLQQKQRNIPQKSFKRYVFTSYPFCGIKWNIIDDNDNNNDNINDNLSYNTNTNTNTSISNDIKKNIVSKTIKTGWLCGGNVYIEYIRSERKMTNCILVNDKEDINIITINKNNKIKELYPFIIELKCRDSDTVNRICLACDNYENQQIWINEIRKMEQMLKYIIASYESNIIPCLDIYSKAEFDNHTLIIDNRNLSVRMMTSISTYYKLLGSEGSLLDVISLNNTQLYDKHAPVLASLLECCPHLRVLSLQSNFLTYKGIELIKSALINCHDITTLDLSSNCLDDNSAPVLSTILSSMANLQHLSLASNQLTGNCVEYLKLTAMKLISINLAHNLLGDGAIGILNMLLYTRPVMLKYCNLSFCGLGDDGIQELIMTIQSCTTLLYVNIRGAQMTPSTLTKFMDAITRHHDTYAKYYHKNNSKKELPLKAILGGVLIEDASLISSLTFKGFNAAVPYTGDAILVDNILLRRKLDGFQEVNGKEILKLEDSPLICLQIQLPVHINSVNDFMVILADALSINTMQLRLVSVTEVSGPERIYSLTIIIEEMTTSPSFIYRNPNVSRFAGVRLDPWSNTSMEAVDIYKICSNLESMVEQSSPILNMIGVRTAYIKRKNLNYGSDSKRSFINNKEGNSQYCYTHKNVSGTSPESYGDFRTPLLPSTILVGHNFQYNGQLEDYHVHLGLHFHPLKKSDEEELRNKIDKTLLKFKPKNKKSEKSKNKALLREQNRSKMRSINEHLVRSIRALRTEDEISDKSCKFWEGALGNQRYKGYSSSVTQSAMDDEGIYLNVGIRTKLCSAINDRDIQKIKGLKRLILEKNIDGGRAVVFGERMLATIASLKREAENISNRAQTPDDLDVLEDFLLTCAVVGYRGKETLDAVNLRTELIRWGIQDQPKKFAALLPSIKKKAYLTNLMISRDMETLTNVLKKDDGSEDSNLVIVAARNLIEEFEQLIDDMKEALVGSTLKELEDLLASAAYHNFSCPEVEDVQKFIVELSSDHSKILGPIVTGIRENNLTMIDEAFASIKYIGLSHPAVDLNLIRKIVLKNERLYQEDNIKVKMMKLSLAIKTGLKFDPSDLVQVYARAKSMKLKSDPLTDANFKLLESHCKIYLGLNTQIRNIQDMLLTNNIEGLELLLSGKGEGRIVINALSGDMLNEWMRHLQDTINGKHSSSKEVTMSGVLEKAARKVGKISGWKRRNFVLQGDMLTYYIPYNSKYGGTKKGCVLVTGGMLQRLNPEEVRGRLHCFEVQEGRDLSLIDAGLLEEVRKKVRAAQQDKITQHLINTVGDLINISSASLPSKTNESSVTKYHSLMEDLIDALNKVKKLGLLIDAELIAYFKKITDSYLAKKFVRELATAVKIIPHDLKLIINDASTLNIDRKNKYLMRLVAISKRSIFEQQILRARGALELGMTAVFKQEVDYLDQIDYKRFDFREQTLFVALLLQYSGYEAMKSSLQGLGVQPLLRLLSHTYSKCRIYYVNTEPMKLTSLLMSMIKDQSATNDSFNIISNEKAGHNSRYELTNYSFLNLGATNIDDIIPNFRKKTTTKGDNDLFFTSKSITKSIRQISIQKTPIAIQIFDILLVIMGDRNIDVLKKVNDKVISIRKDNMTIVTLATDLIRLLIKSDVTIQEEAYLQLCKQLSCNTNGPTNPTSDSRLKGWLLFSLYLHYFVPSGKIILFLAHFVQVCLQTETEIYNNLKNKSNNNDDDDNENNNNNNDDDDNNKRNDCQNSKMITKTVGYCQKLINWLQNEYKNDDKDNDDDDDDDKSILTRISGKRSNNSNNNGRSELMNIGQICDLVLNFKSISISINSFNRVIELDVAIGICDTPLSLFQLLYEKISGNSIDEYQLLLLVRGYAMYVNSNDDSNIIPTQLNENAMIDWNTDIIWNVLNGDTDSIILRHRLSLASESFTDLDIIFNNDISDTTIDIDNNNDNNNTNNINTNNWTKWLLSAGEVPIDSHTLDLQFHEKLNFVNSGLYYGTKEMRAYAIALQLMLRKEQDINSNNDDDYNDDDNDDDDNNNNNNNDNSDNSDDNLNDNHNDNMYGRHNDDDDSANWSDDSSSVNSTSNVNPALGLGSSTLQKKRFNIDKHDHNIDIKTRLIGIGLGNDDNLTASVDYWVNKMKESKIYNLTKPYSIDESNSNNDNDNNNNDNNNISNANISRWNYFIKRSYLTYIRSWPLYGVHLAKASLLRNSNNNDDEEVEVLIGLSGRGLYLLNANTWSLVFKCPYYHISSCTLVPDGIDVILSIVVNGMPVELRSFESTNLHRMITDYIVEILGRGGYLYGSEGGDNILSLTSVVSTADSTEIFKSYLKDFSVLPSPPSPINLTPCEEFFEAPKDNDENIAMLKIQEEIKEKEQLRFVLATQGQKQQALLQKGRMGLSNMSNKDRKTQRRTNKLTVNLATNVDYSNSNEPQRKIEDSILGTSRKSYKMLYDYDSSTHSHHTSASVFAEIPKKYFLKE